MSSINRRVQSNFHAKTARRALILGSAAAMFVATRAAPAAQFNWDPGATNSAAGGGPGTWDSVTPIWFNGASDVVWPNTAAPNGDEAIFGGATSGAVTLGEPINANIVTFNTDGYSVSGNTLTLSGTTPTVNVNAGTATIASALAGNGGWTKAGAGTLVLGAANSFSSGVNITGGTLSYSASNQIGSNGIALSNGAALRYTGNTQHTITNAFNFGAGGGVIDAATPGGNGSLNKIFIGTTNTFTGSGPITKTGPGYIQIGSAASLVYTGSWIINGGVVECGQANGLGAATVPVTVNSGGEICSAFVNIPNPVTLNGGIVSTDKSTVGTFSGAMSVTADSKIRLGDFFDGTNRDLRITGNISGSGALSFINAQTWNASGTVATPSNPSGNFVLMGGDNRTYSGVLTVDGGHGVQFGGNGAANANSVPTSAATSVVVSSTSTAMTLIGVGFNLAPPTLNIQPNTTGVLSINNSGYNQALDMSTLYGGTWFIGADSFNGSCFSTITPAVDPNDASKRLYRLGGGGGSIFLGGTNQIRDYNPGTGAITSNVVIGDPRVFGSGSVRYGSTMSYTGTTTIANGTLLLNFIANSTPANTQVFFGTPTSNGTLDLAGFGTTVGGLNVAAGADPTKQAIGNSSTVNNVTLTVNNTTAGDSSFAGNIRNTLGAGNKTLALALVGPSKLTLSGSNSYTGGTSVNGGSLAMIGSNAWSPVLTAPAGTDLKHGALVFDYSNGSTDPSPTIQSVLTTAFASGFASGQIHSSTATPSVGLGWLDDTANSRAVVAYTLFGDANLDFTVDTVDFNNLAANFSSTTAVWGQGDFNYDGAVDTVDFNLLAANFSQTLAAPATSPALGALVPEPTACAMLLLGGLVLGARRRRA